MITKPCRKHPRYEGKHPPKTCLVCWAIYRKVHGIVGRGPVKFTPESFAYVPTTDPATAERVLGKWDRAAEAKPTAVCAVCGYTKDEHGRMAFTCPPRVGAKKGTWFEEAKR